MAQLGYEEDASQVSGGVSQGFAAAPPRNNDAALFVGGLSFSANEEDLRQVCICMYVSD